MRVTLELTEIFSRMSPFELSLAAESGSSLTEKFG